MKGIDFLIFIMFVIVVGSGGYMGYLLYEQNMANQQAIIAEDEKIDSEEVLLCIDEDGDGYGLNCDLGNDCDDTNSELNEICEKKLDSTLALNIKDQKEKYEIGEQFEVLIKAEDIPSLLLESIELRVEYNSSVLKYVKSETTDTDYTPIELEPTENQVRIDYAVPEGVQNMDEFVKLIFEAQSNGLADIRVSPDTRVGVEYQIKSGSVGVIVGTGATESATSTPSATTTQPILTAVPTTVPATN